MPIVKACLRAIGDQLMLQNRQLTVVGIGRLRGIRATDQGSSGLAFLDVRTLRELSGTGNVLGVIMVHVGDASDPALIQAQLQANLDSVDSLDRSQVLRAVGKLASEQTMEMWTGAVLAMVIAIVFVSSMLLRSVAERGTELGTLRAIGASNRTILGLVIADSLFVALAAIPIGIGVGQVIGQLINSMYAASLDMDALYRPDPSLLAVFFGLSMSLGVLASLLPVRAALRVEPADVLREA